jgi:hypothetical protein
VNLQERRRALREAIAKALQVPVADGRVEDVMDALEDFVRTVAHEVMDPDD